MYYSDSAVRNATVYYTKDDAGLHATVNGVTHSQDPFTTATAWFPDYTKLNHVATSGVNNALTNTYITEYTANTLKFAGITSIPDSDSNVDYAFGYADVTPVPSVKDGTPVNPYTPYTSDKVGGDGFDLAWAVEIGGTTPVKVDNAKYVRIYSAVLYNTGIFGETSPEITGIFRAVGTTAETASPVTVSINGAGIDPEDDAEQISRNVYYYHAGLTAGTAISVSANETANVYINGAYSNTFTTTANTAAVQIVVQSGTAEAFILVID